MFYQPRERLRNFKTAEFHQKFRFSLYRFIKLNEETMSKTIHIVKSLPAPLFTKYSESVEHRRNKAYNQKYNFKFEIKIGSENE